jgi:hypothetical protein
MKAVDVSSLEHTTWRCQYHVVFAPKYRRLEIYGKIKQDLGAREADDDMRSCLLRRTVRNGRISRRSGAAVSYRAFDLPGMAMLLQWCLTSRP